MSWDMHLSRLHIISTYFLASLVLLLLMRSGLRRGLFSDLDQNLGIYGSC